jgi:hypothetical protein
VKGFKNHAIEIEKGKFVFLIILCNRCVCWKIIFMFYSTRWKRCFTQVSPGSIHKNSNPQ